MCFPLSHSPQLKRQNHFYLQGLLTGSNVIQHSPTPSSPSLPDTCTDCFREEEKYSPNHTSCALGGRWKQSAWSDCCRLGTANSGRGQGPSGKLEKLWAISGKYFHPLTGYITSLSLFLALTILFLGPG